MPRQSRKLISTGIYHIMLRGNERKSIFQDSEDKQRFVEGIEAKQKDISFSVYAYCLMDNHVHLLLNMHNHDLSAVMQAKEAGNRIVNGELETKNFLFDYPASSHMKILRHITVNKARVTGHNLCFNQAQNFHVLL